MTFSTKAIFFVIVNMILGCTNDVHMEDPSMTVNLPGTLIAPQFAECEHVLRENTDSYGADAFFKCLRRVLNVLDEKAFCITCLTYREGSCLKEGGDIYCDEYLSDGDYEDIACMQQVLDDDVEYSVCISGREVLSCTEMCRQNALSRLSSCNQKAEQSSSACLDEATTLREGCDRDMCDISPEEGDPA
jgi:hypothetical protein